MGRGNEYRDRDRRRGFGGDRPEEPWGAERPQQRSSFDRGPPRRDAVVSSGPEREAKVKWFNGEKGFGFVEFSDAEQAKAALSMNGTDFGGRTLTVNEARPRAEGTTGGRSGRPRY